jgi:hypothetical protein
MRGERHAEPRPVWWPPHLAWPPVSEPPVEVL